MSERVEIQIIQRLAMYTKEKKMMLWCVASRNEIAIIKDIAKRIDPASFVVISNAREAWGKGFR